MEVGRIASLHRYPVKSMIGEDLDRSLLGEQGLPGDRAWAVRDEKRGGIRGAKKIPELMTCSARYPEEPEVGAPAPAAEITAPDGARFLAGAPDAGKRISEAIGHEVTLWPLLPADALDHYERGAPDDPDMMSELRSIFARLPEEPLPDLGRFPPEILQYESPPGTYFDAFPLLIVTRASLDAMQARAPGSRFDVRRFRPNLVIDTGASEAPFPEQGWIGRTLRIGEVGVRVEMECPRCVMTTHGFEDLPKDPKIMRALVREAGGNLGVYASVERAGAISLGDTVELV